MKKSDLTTLLDTYNGRNNTRHTSYTKGFWRRTFHSTTEGIDDLQSLVDNELRSTSSEENISGDTLLKLLDILDDRAKRIVGTPRSYENQPGKATNQVFEEIYKHLWADIVSQEPRAYSAPGLLNIEGAREELAQAAADHETFVKPELENANSIDAIGDAFDRGRTRAAEFHRQAARERDSEETRRIKETLFLRESQKLAFKLSLSEDKLVGVVLAAGGTMPVAGTSIRELAAHSHKIDQAMKTFTGPDIQNVAKNIDFDDQSVTCVCTTFDDGKLFDAEVIPFRITIMPDMEAGINMLKQGSKDGNKSASMLLAKYYAGLDRTLVNDHPDRAKTVYYLEKSRDQGSQTAAAALDAGYLKEFSLSSSPGLRRH